ncbi:response regulator [Chloroflexales bacterium ZM16-3]|nr:response regulator [Chloroflexales bacterium ZM16-3]
MYSNRRAIPMGHNNPISVVDQEHIIALLQDAVIISDLEFRIRSWNDAAAQLYGWAADEVQGQLLSEVIPALRYLDGGDRETAIEVLVRDGFWRGEIIQPHRSGEELTINTSVQALRDTEGRPQAYIAINRNVSGQRVAEQALRRYAERLNILHHMNQRTLAGAPLDAIIAEVLDQLRLLVQVQHASVLIYSSTAQRRGTFLGVSSDLDGWPAVGDVIDMSGGSVGMIDQAHQVRIYHDLPPTESDEDTRPHDIASILRDKGLHSLLSIPLMVDGELIGSLNLATSSPQEFPDDQIAIAREFGAYLAISVQSARLRENERRARQIAETLHQAGVALTQSLDLNQVLEALLDHLQKLVPYDSANVMLLREGQIFQVYSLRGYEHRADIEEIRQISFDAREHSITRQIMQSWRSLLISDTLGYPGWVEVAGGEEIRSWMGIPIISRGELLGIYAVNKMTPGFFSEDSVTMAETLSTVAAVAITNALLYTQAQQELAERRRAEENLEAERTQLARRVTERTADLIAANAELARAARLKDEFLANMSHELRTPLNTILGRAEILHEQIYGPLTDQQQYAIGSIDESGRHLLALINDILDLSKIEAGKLELQISTVDVSALCQACVRMMAQVAAAKGISLSTTFDMAITHMQADERRLKQILVNLLSNAVKFTAQGGRVSLEVRGSRDRSQIEFSVSDTGIGIAATDIPRLFHPFIQIDAGLARQHEGTGLGLSLVLRLAEAHGGSVAVSSAPNEGSRFSVTLPWDATPVLIASADADDDTLLPLARALIIDDSQASSEQFARYLTDLGCAVTIHERAGGALDLAVELRPDLIMLDVLLPDQTGWAILRQLKGDPRTADIPVLVISVVDEPDLARQLGAAAHLVKPISRADLMRALRKLVRPRLDVGAAPATALPPNAQGRRILLAEDNEDNISLMRDYLPLYGYELFVARDGSEAITMARAIRPEAILMDIQMPVMDGIEATMRIRADAELCDIPVIALTALAMPGDRDRCLAAGADAYVVKPVRLRELPVQIEEAIQLRTPRAE